MKRLAGAALISMMLGAMLPGPALAGSFEVAPTTISLAPGARYAALYITNRGDAPLAVQIEAFDWRQGPEGDELTPSDALMVSPPMTQLAPGRKQTVRLAVNPAAPGAGERAFRLLLSELPAEGRAADSGVGVLLQFSVPLFADTAQQKPVLRWRVEQEEGAFILALRNEGPRHAKLSEVTLSSPAGAKKMGGEGFSYLLAGAQKRWKLDALPAEGAALSARDEQSGVLRAVFQPAARP